MPTYEYECPEGHRFELFQKMSDHPVADCPQCGKPAGRRISSGAGFLFKGEGFYITDYRSKEYKDRAAAETGGGSETGKGKGKGSDGEKAGPSGDLAPGAGGDKAGPAEKPKPPAPGDG